MPFIKYVGESELTTTQLVEALRSAVGRRAWLGGTSGSKPFFGDVSASHFRVTRVVSGRNSFNPVAYGKLQPSALGTKVSVVMTFHPFVWLFVGGWTVAHGYAFVRSVLKDGEPNWMAAGFLAFLWAMALPGFVFAARRTRSMLNARLHLRTREEPVD